MNGPFRAIPGDFDPNSNMRSMQTALEWIRDGSIVTDGIYELFTPQECSVLYPNIRSGKIRETMRYF